ncbi:hypothetical protein B0H14DRAFT_3513253 [Mycena olivaceomarginata]|nr:hypothetical protein B0H14DRAFT_3513253 [Mycena olivaceomarginata]
MTSFTPAAPGAEGHPSAPVAALPAGNDPETVAALHTLVLALSHTRVTSPESPAAAAVPATAPPPAAALPAAPVAAPAAVAAAPATVVAASAVVAAPAVAAPAHVGFQTRGPWVAGALFLVVPTGPLTHIPEDPAPEGLETLWYCITRGKYIGLTTNNSLAMAAVIGVSRSSMKSYKTQALAVAAFNEMLQFNLVQILA